MANPCGDTLRFSSGIQAEEIYANFSGWGGIRMWHHGLKVPRYRPGRAGTPQKARPLGMECRSEGIASRHRIEDPDEFVDQQLGREDANDCHIVPYAQDTPIPGLLDKFLNCGWVKDFVAPDPVRRNELFHVFVAARAEEAICVRGAKWLLGTVDHRCRNQPGSTSLEQIL